MFEKYLDYVKNYLIQTNGYYPPDVMYRFRCKFDHIKRVLKWCKVLEDDLPEINKEALYTAAIFHDVGYGCKGKNSHAITSAEIFAEYARDNRMDRDFAEMVTYMIKMHSNKELLGNPETMPELILLMEADLLDEEGALRVIWYCATKAIQGAESYLELRDFIQMGSDKRLENPMVTPIARKKWDEKICLVNSFMEELTSDIDTEDLL